MKASSMIIGCRQVYKTIHINFDKRLSMQVNCCNTLVLIHPQTKQPMALIKYQSISEILDKTGTAKIIDFGEPFLSSEKACIKL